MPPQPMNEQHLNSNSEQPSCRISNLDPRIMGRFAQVLAEYEHRDPNTLRLGETMVVDIAVIEDMISQLSSIGSLSEKATPLNLEAKKAEEQFYKYRNNNYKLNRLLNALKDLLSMVDKSSNGQDESTVRSFDQANRLARLIDEVGTHSLPTNLVPEEYFINLDFGDESFKLTQEDFAPLQEYLADNDGNRQHITLPTHEFLNSVQRLDDILRLVDTINRANEWAADTKDYLEECRLLCKRKLKLIQSSLMLLSESSDDTLSSKAQEIQIELNTWLTAQKI